MPAKYWLCRKCGARHPRLRQKCGEAVRVWGVDDVEYCDGRRPKARMTRHKEVLRGDTYPAFEAFNELVHGPAMPGEWTKDCCGVCGKPPKGKHHDRDHDHRTGQMRGLACPGNQGCNVLMVPWVTVAAAYGIAREKQVAGEPDAERWAMIYRYLRRVEEHYA